MKHFTPRRHNEARKIGKAAAIFTATALLVALPSFANAQKPDKGAKAQPELAADSSALAKFESIKQKLMDERAKNDVAVLFGQTITTEIPARDSTGYYNVPDPKGGTLISLSSDEFMNAANGTKPRGQSFLVYRSEYKMYLTEVAYGSLPTGQQ